MERKTRKYTVSYTHLTNDKEFLKDQTGNRRFWPIDLGKIPSRKNVFGQLPGEVDQIWAEAFMRWQCGEKLFLEGAVAEEAVRQQEEHKESNPKAVSYTHLINGNN